MLQNNNVHFLRDHVPTVLSQERLLNDVNLFKYTSQNALGR